MEEKKKKTINGIGIFTLHLTTVDGWVVRWIDRKAKAKITLELVEEPCALCGKLTTGDKLCAKCEKIICDECAKVDGEDRYCPDCFKKKKSLHKLA